MRLDLRATCVVVSMALGGCSRSDQTSQARPASAVEAGTQLEVERTIRAFFGGFSVATCTDGSAVSRFARDPSIYVDDTEVVSVSFSDFFESAREPARGAATAVEWTPLWSTC